MKDLIKKWWFWAIIAFVVIIFIALIISIKVNKKEGVGTAGISKSEFDEIQIGKTTNYDLSHIIDKKNEWNDNNIYSKCVEQISEARENSKYTYIYKYFGEESGYAIVTLQADYSNGYFYNDVIVIKKEAFNLK